MKRSEYPKPQNVIEMRLFLGLANFQRKFIHQFATIAKPLTSISGGPKKKIDWNEEMEEMIPEGGPPRGESGKRRVEGDPSQERLMLLQVTGKWDGGEPLGPSPISHLTITEGPFPSQGRGALYKEQRGKGPVGFRSSAANLGLGLRSRISLKLNYCYLIYIFLKH